MNYSFFDQIVDTLSDALITIDQDKNVVVWNKMAEIMFGYDRAEMEMIGLEAIIPPAYRQSHREGYERFVNDIAARASFVSEVQELEALHKSGEVFPIELTHSLVKVDDQEFYITAIVRDTTLRKRYELMRERAEKEAKDFSEFLKKVFGRYLSPEVMNSLLKNPAALELGGKRREVTIMIMDLRGFTALAERLDPEQVVALLNNYFEIMVDMVDQYQGTINEIIGDSALVLFGAPLEMRDRVQKAIACAIAMQNAMAEVNDKNREQGLPRLEMGIGLHDTEVIVGNIGSTKRFKYSVVGSGVNLTSRIESYTVGGQIFVSESVRNRAGEVLRIDAQREVLPQGADVPIRIYEIGGISGQYNLALEERDAALYTLKQAIPLRCVLLKEKLVCGTGTDGFIVRLSPKSAEINLNSPLELFTNIKMNLLDVYEELAIKDFYGKVIERSTKDESIYVIRFTSLPPEVAAYFLAHRKHAETIDGESLSHQIPGSLPSVNSI